MCYQHSYILSDQASQGNYLLQVISLTFTSTDLPYSAVLFHLQRLTVSKSSLTALKVCVGECRAGEHSAEQRKQVQHSHQHEVDQRLLREEDPEHPGCFNFLYRSYKSVHRSVPILRSRGAAHPWSQSFHSQILINRRSPLRTSFRAG